MFSLEPQQVTQHLQKNQEIVSSFDISQFKNIQEAFVSLTAEVSRLLQNEDFYAMRRSCIEQMHTSSGVQLSPDMAEKIKTASNMDALLDTLVGSPYWSWIDLRLLEAMVVASGSKAAIGIFTMYQRNLYSTRLIEVLPSIPDQKARDAYYSKIVSIVQKDLEKITVYDLLEFKSELETVIMDIKSGVLG